jgi:leader peptidase (prepilin peptidase)/N-methyltransferase
MVVELLGALLCVGIAERFVVHAAPGAELLPVSLSALAYFVFEGGLLIATFIDLEWLVIPDEVSLPGAALGLLVAGNGAGLVSAQDAALGAALGFLFVQLVFVWAYERVTGRRGMGEGDPKLLLMIGAFLGWKGVLFSVVAGSMQGLLAAAVSYVAGSSLLPPRTDDPFDQWEREDLVAYLRDLFGRHPELQASEEALYRVDFGPPAAPGEAPAGGLGGADAEAVMHGLGDEADEEAPAEGADPSATHEATVPPEERAMIPFGPFLALGALEFLFFGERLLDAYFGLF